MRYLETRAKNIKKLQDKGLEILSNWDGTTGAGKKSLPIAVTVRNTQCGHTFTSSSKNLLNRGITCAVCGKLERASNINHWSELNSARWRQTATPWKLYKSKVTSLTRKTYIANKAKINPNNLPKGRAGTKGAYHLDHIVPIRYCFEHGIPAELCSHPENLQMLPWNQNVAFRSKIKENIPLLFEQYL